MLSERGSLMAQSIVNDDLGKGLFHWLFLNAILLPGRTT